MTKQKTPHTQTQQNTRPEQTDFDGDQSGSKADEQIYREMEGAQTGTDRSLRKIQTSAIRGRRIQPEATAHEGSLSTRTPKRPTQGISSRSAEEESRRQQKVVNDRSDARAGVNKK